jgi:hypothetical protein
MLTEFLVLYTCATGLDGCAESRSAYLQQNPQMQTYVTEVSKSANRVAKTFYADKAAPVIAAALSRRVTLPLTKRFTISVTDKIVETKIVYGVDF